MKKLKDELSRRFSIGCSRLRLGGIGGKCLATLALAIAAVLPARATEFYTSPLGVASGTGSSSSPWDLQTAINQPSSVQPGDTIWMRGGVYQIGNHPTKFISRLSGTSSAPITLRQYPGEHATIDGNLQQLSGGWAVYWGFEIMDSQTFGPGITPTRTTSQSGPFPTTWWTTYNGKQTDFTVSGFDLQAPNCKLINLVIHDNLGGGIGMDTAAGNTEVYGTLSYYNGWQSTVDRGHGHGIYGQNVAPAVKHVYETMSFDNFALGMQATGAGPNPVADNFDVEGSAFFLNGALATSHQQNLLIGAFQGVAQHPVVISNFIYDIQGSGSDFFMGYDGGSINGVVQGNYFQTSAQFGNNTAMTMTGNTFLAGTIGINQASYPNNSYLTTKPTVNVVSVRPNKYEPGRANIIIYNWQLLNSVAVDVSSVLPVGTSYHVVNAQNFYGQPVASGTYTGGTISLPMTGLTVAAPVGTPTPASSGPAFNAFILLPTSAVTNTPPPDTAPTLSSVANQTLAVNNATPAIPFTIGDAETAASSLTLSAGSSNPTLVPAANIVFGGSASARTVTVTPALNQSGSATITLSVSDGVKSSSTTFVLTVAAMAPTISSLANESTLINIATPAIAFTLADMEAPVANLTLSGNSSNPTLVPNANIVFGGSGSNRTVMVTPMANQTGNATITISANDGVTSASASFTLSVTAPVPPAQTVYLPMDATAGILVAPMMITTNAQTSALNYVSSATANQGSDTFMVNIPVTGVYDIWGRVLSPSSASDSFFVSVDNGPEDVFDDAEGKWTNTWQWSVVNGRAGTVVPLTLNPRTFLLTQGTHTIKFRGREANATLNRILISNDLGFVPKEVTAVNETLTAAANATTQFPQSAFLGNAGNLSGGILLLSLSSAYSSHNGTVTVCGGNVSYTPAPGFTGTDTFTFSISDGAGNSSTATATVTVQSK